MIRRWRWSFPEYATPSIHFRCRLNFDFLKIATDGSEDLFLDKLCQRQGGAYGCKILYFTPSSEHELTLFFTTDLHDLITGFPLHRLI